MTNERSANSNLEYASMEIVDFYSSHRRRWEELYPSEQWVFERIAGEEKSVQDVLDVGCACGGMAEALASRFRMTSYTGIDIHREAIRWAAEHCRLKVPIRFVAGDILETRLDSLYHTVVSLSCADWNIETERIISACWGKVGPKGYLVISLRLTNTKGINDIKDSYQWISFSQAKKECEKAVYVVFNAADALRQFQAMIPAPRLIGAYGYWGEPSPTAVTPYDRLVFAVFYLQKGTGQVTAKDLTRMELELPQELMEDKR